MDISTVAMSALRRIYYAALIYGIDPKKFLRSLRATPEYLSDYRRFKARTDNSFPLMGPLYPILSEKSGEAGTAKGHYFHQDIWAAQKVIQRRPVKHLDVGSRVDGFVAHLLSAKIPVTVIDIRPLKSSVEYLDFHAADAQHMEGIQDNSVDSLSSLHAVEHFGLGRYGDPIDPSACFRAMHSFVRVLAPNGRLYFSTPIGRERVEFNAHRVFSPARIIQAFESLTLVSFRAIDDAGNFVIDRRPVDFQEADYSCGLFEFTKS